MVKKSILPTCRRMILQFIRRCRKPTPLACFRSKAVPRCPACRAMGFKRSEARMKQIEIKLRAGMERNGISREAQEQIILSITSFAQYGFPESHAASFALTAYASAYLKCHYLAAFTAAMLNNQPMGFYSPATLVKDAQRHGLKVKPIDVTKSDWLCTLENGAMRVGMRYVKGMRESVAHAIVN